MPQLLLELLSEDIPARMQAAAGEQLARLAGERLREADLEHDRLESFAGLRRLTLVVDGLPLQQPVRAMERRGPRSGAPAAALEGFRRSTPAEAELFEKDGAWFARWRAGGKPTENVLPDLVERIAAGFSWPKSMAWGDGSLRWVRPLRRILLVFDRRPIPFSLAGVEAADISEGHRFLGESRTFRARDFDEYREALAGHHVVLTASERRERVLGGARSACRERGLELVEDEGLTQEVTGMAEWPTPLLGEMEARFLDLPPEVIRTAMRVHQRYFAVRRREALSPHFVMVADRAPTDGGRLILAGAARVLSARLEDARFFWREDLSHTLESRLDTLAGVTFHERLGSMRERALRLEATAGEIAARVGADPALAAEAGRLAKCDLATAMVGEFPELQGAMGGRYAREEGLAPEVCDAIADHYRPLGPSDLVPSAPVTIAVALADKMTAIAGFFSIGEKPTGSKDPYALRRAALGVLRIVLDNRLRLPLGELARLSGAKAGIAEEIIAFVADRFSVMLREQGARYDIVEAVFAIGDDDMVRVGDRVAALSIFLAGPEGADLVAGYRRAGNILEAEARKGSLPSEDEAAPASSPPEEEALRAALAEARVGLAVALDGQDDAAALAALARLREPVDAFFDKVLVNAQDPRERAARLSLLIGVRSTMGRVADFSRIVAQ